MSPRPSDPLVSVVAPAFNEEENLAEFHRRVVSALAGVRFELVIVDDGSRDRTFTILQELERADPRVRPVRLSRNFGHQAAVTAGLELARGDVVVTIDVDLQDPPEVIAELLESWRDGGDVVHAVRHVRPGEPRLRLLGIRLFYRLFERISGLDEYAANSGDFRLLDREALDALNALPERNRFVRGLVSWIGFDQRVVEYERHERFAGESKYPFVKLLQLATDGVISFSVVPLRLAAFLGFIFSGLAFLAVPVVIVLRLLGLYQVSGIASVHILVLLVGGIQLVFLGVIGEYLARSYDEAKGRPVYIIRPADRGGREDPRPDERAPAR